MGYLSALIAMVFLGIGNYLFKKSTEALGPIHTTLFYYLFGAMFAALVWILVQDKEPVQKSSLLWPALTALFIGVSVLAYTSALKSINVSIASTLMNLSFLATILLAVLFSKEQLGGKDYLAILFALAAVVLFGMGGSPNEKQSREIVVGTNLNRTDESP